MKDGRTDRALHVLVAVVLAVSVMGYFAGTHHAEVSSDAHRLPPSSGPKAVQQAPSYGELRARGPLREAGGEAAFDALASSAPSRLEPVDAQPDQKLASIQTREVLRAYDGAPPVIPHAISQRGAPSCLACHANGTKVGERVAPKMSHATYTNCIQCHVTTEFPFPAPAPQLAQAVGDSSFVGLEPPTAGERAWPGAPPTIPHTTQMRGECMSCHGIYGKAGLRTTHPWRQSCTQCHAPSAELDQRPLSLR